MNSPVQFNSVLVQERRGKPFSGIRQMGRLKTWEWKTRERQKCRGGNRGKNEYGEQKFPFFNNVYIVESSIGLVYPSG